MPSSAAVKIWCFALLVCSGFATAAAQSACETLINLHLKGAKVLSAAMQPPSDIPATSTRLAAHASEHCEVKGMATPTGDSVINRWVVDGAAPERIVAMKLPEKITRPLCAYPRVARYQGAGSTDDAENFRCVTPPGEGH